MKGQPKGDAYGGYSAQPPGPRGRGRAQADHLSAAPLVPGGYQLVNLSAADLGGLDAATLQALESAGLLGLAGAGGLGAGALAGLDAATLAAAGLGVGGLGGAGMGWGGAGAGAAGGGGGKGGRRGTGGASVGATLNLDAGLGPGSSRHGAGAGAGGSRSAWPAAGGGGGGRNGSRGFDASQVYTVAPAGGGLVGADPGGELLGAAHVEDALRLLMRKRRLPSEGALEGLLMGGGGDAEADLQAAVAAAMAAGAGGDPYRTRPDDALSLQYASQLSDHALLHAHLQAQAQRGGARDAGRLAAAGSGGLYAAAPQGQRSKAQGRGSQSAGYGRQGYDEDDLGVEPHTLWAQPPAAKASRLPEPPAPEPEASGIHAQLLKALLQTESQRRGRAPEDQRLLDAGLYAVAAAEAEAAAAAEAQRSQRGQGQGQPRRRASALELGAADAAPLQMQMQLVQMHEGDPAAARAPVRLMGWPTHGAPAPADSLGSAGTGRRSNPGLPAGSSGAPGRTGSQGVPPVDVARSPRLSGPPPAAAEPAVPDTRLFADTRPMDGASAQGAGAAAGAGAGTVQGTSVPDVDALLAAIERLSARPPAFCVVSVTALLGMHAAAAARRGAQPTPWALAQARGLATAQAAAAMAGASAAQVAALDLKPLLVLDMGGGARAAGGAAPAAGDRWFVLHLWLHEAGAGAGAGGTPGARGRGQLEPLRAFVARFCPEAPLDAAAAGGGGAGEGEALASAVLELVRVLPTPAASGLAGLEAVHGALSGGAVPGEATLGAWLGAAEGGEPLRLSWEAWLDAPGPEAGGGRGAGLASSAGPMAGEDAQALAGHRALLLLAEAASGAHGRASPAAPAPGRQGKAGGVGGA
ncbi:hypothetical protein HYH03_006657 [Edaphochlamys debaryana]|uniref:Uncharacterized protein n=1 Tax=Edaphochlamys debaryana TaxID=47281 RepID=A0A835Y3K9_9CHLO|nr:hypothetical protein HYH03_006657 [Edaphochlamys debaryana]|eukprot:KAG2495390.1 hypothetical protein HYH03_006657 [Edaphochlamys debaryana]